MRWRSFTRADPCPICGHGGWCRSDGAFIVCQRALKDGGEVRTDRNGGEYFLYRIDGVDPTKTFEDEEKFPEEKRAADKDVDRVYNAFLDELVLPTERAAGLLGRGVPGETIERCKFREHPGPERARAALATIRHKLNVHWFCDIPGFYKTGGNNTLVAGTDGLLIPVRNLDGLIVAMRLRVDDPNTEAKYRWFSRPERAFTIGASSGAHVHVPLHAPEQRGELIRVTEGELKAEIAFAKTGVLTLSVPGVGMWRLALPVMKLIGAKRVLLAWDADQRKNPHVARALERAAIVYRDEGFEVGLETWPEAAGKGIDDVLVGAAPGSIQQVWGADAWKYIADLVAGVGKEPEMATERNVVLERLAEAGPLAHDMAMLPEVIEAAANLLDHDPEGFEKLIARVKPYILVTQFRGAIKRRASEIRKASKKHGGKPRIEFADGDWRATLIRAENGSIVPCLENAVCSLQRAPEWQGVIAYDNFRNCVWKLRTPPWDLDVCPEESRRTGEWSDEDDIRCAFWIGKATGAHISPQMASAAVQVVAQTHGFHPVRDWLESLRWDGRPRIHNWLTTYLGATKQPENYLLAVGSKFLMGAIARVMQPGCKNDSMLVLEGPQGAGKSTAIRTLAGAEFYAVHGEAVGTKDSYVVLRGQWILEIAELDSLARSETTAIKRYLSQQSDTYRPPYGRRAVSVPRQCVFLGSTNQDAYLADETGARRFWPVTCGAIDLEHLEKDASQIWAEAFIWYREGKPWWPEPETALLLGREQDTRYRDDPWEELLRDHLNGKNSLRMSDLLRVVCGDPTQRKWEERDKMRVGRILKRLGWARYRTREGERGTLRGYGYARPGYRPTDMVPDDDQGEAPETSSVPPREADSDSTPF